MKNVNTMTADEIETMADQVIAFQDENDSELFRIIGSNMHSSGLVVSNNPNELVDFAPNWKNRALMLNMDADAAFDAVAAGAGFWERFKAKIHQMICSNEQLRNIIMGDGSLRQKLIAAIPIILTLLGIAALTPPMVAVIAAALAFIARAGFAAYCNW